jgi:hypothetical protein
VVCPRIDSTDLDVGTKLLIAGMKANDYFSFILACSSASPEVVQVYASIVYDHDDDVDGGVYHSVARYTDRHSEDSHSNRIAAQRPRQVHCQVNWEALKSLPLGECFG